MGLALTGHWAALNTAFRGGIGCLRNGVGHRVAIRDRLPFVDEISFGQLERACFGITDTMLIGGIEDFLLKKKPLDEEHFLRVGERVYPRTTWGQALCYGIGIGQIENPWRKLLIPPFNRLNVELSRWGSDSYDKPEFYPLSKAEELLRVLLAKLNAKLHYDVDDDGGRETHIVPIGTRSGERDLLNSSFAFSNVFQNADIGYLLLILYADGIGLKHDHESVRKGTLNLIDGFIISIVQGVSLKLEEPDSPLLSESQQHLRAYNDGIELLSCVVKVFYMDDSVLDDKDALVKARAKEVLEKAQTSIKTLDVAREKLLATL